VQLQLGAARDLALIAGPPGLRALLAKDRAHGFGPVSPSTWTCASCLAGLGFDSAGSYDPATATDQRCHCCNSPAPPIERLVAVLIELRDVQTERCRPPVDPAPGVQLAPVMRPLPPPKLVPISGGPAPAANRAMPSAEGLWGVKEAASFLGMSTDWVYRASEQGRLPYRKLGSRLRFVPDEIQEWASGNAR
jgi:excisionase family DNA binding protein